jgi:hypothetical protein
VCVWVSEQHTSTGCCSRVWQRTDTAFQGLPHTASLDVRCCSNRSSPLVCNFLALGPTASPQQQPQQLESQPARSQRAPASFLTWSGCHVARLCEGKHPQSMATMPQPQHQQQPHTKRCASHARTARRIARCPAHSHTQSSLCAGCPTRAAAAAPFSTSSSWTSLPPRSRRQTP